MLFLILMASSAAAYNPDSPLYVKSVMHCGDKPRGVGNYIEREGRSYKKGDDEIFIYVELNNCRSEKRDQFYHINLAVDIDIYYEDGIRVFSEYEANTFDYHNPRKLSEAYIWTKIDASGLKAGGYKVEMTVRDLNSKKEVLTVTKFEVE